MARQRQEEDELQREQKRHEEERQRELDLIVGNPVPSRVKQVPPKFKRRSKSGFTVWSSFGYGNDGWHSYAGPPPKEFDSCFPSIKEAHARARYLFYVKNPWGLGVEELIREEIFEEAGGMTLCDAFHHMSIRKPRPV